MTAAEASVLTPGTDFLHYRIIRPLGEGGMGQVFAAEHSRLGQTVALKVLQGGLASSGEARLRFVREAQAAALIQHPAIVRVLDVGVEHDTPYIVMELLDGQDLSETIATRGALSEGETATYVAPALAGLAHAHEAGIIHRDLKPENLFLQRTRTGVQPKVLDFGIAKVKNPKEEFQLTATGAVMGTPYYMSPEQASGAKSVDERADQYSMGVVLYEAVTGVRPFEAESFFELIRKITTGEFAPPRELKPQIDPDFEAIILRAMAGDPRDRFPSVAALGLALLPYASESVRTVYGPELRDLDLATDGGNPAIARTLPAGATPDRRASSGIRSRSKGPRWGLIAGAVLLGILGLVGVFAIGSSADETAEPMPLASVAESEEVEAQPATYSVSVDVEPSGAAIFLDDERMGTGSFRGQLRVDGERHELRVSMDGYESWSLIFLDSVVEEDVTLDPLPVAEAPPESEPSPMRRRVRPSRMRAQERPTPNTAMAVSPMTQTSPMTRPGANGSIIIR